MMILVRLGALSVLWALGYFALLSSASDDALGTGLLMFLLVVLVSGIWALGDGLRHGPTSPLLTWAVVSICFAVVVSVIDVLHEFGPDWSAFADDLGDSGPFIGGLVLVPAVAGVLTGGLIHSRRGTASPKVSHI